MLTDNRTLTFYIVIILVILFGGRILGGIINIILFILFLVVILYLCFRKDITGIIGNAFHGIGNSITSLNPQ